MDRRSLFIWDANTTAVLNTVILSESRPGQQELLSFPFLTLSSNDTSPPFLVTVNKDFQTLTILDRLGNTSQEIGWNQLKCPWCDLKDVAILGVYINERGILVDVMEYSTNLTFFVFLPLPLGKYY